MVEKIINSETENEDGDKEQPKDNVSQDEEAAVLVQQMFLASSCNDDPKSSLHGRIFACPLAN